MVTEKDKGPWCNTCYTEKVRVGYYRAVRNFQNAHNERMILRSFQANHYDKKDLREITEARRLAGADSWSV